MLKRECIAMILAGGRGERLGSLTTYEAKPAVTFGGKYKIIDFTLNNCIASGINTIGVLTQYLRTELNNYIKKNNGAHSNCEAVPLSPHAGAKYSGTADAIYRNIEFIDRCDPDNVLILSGDHVYDMDYHKMLDFHKERNADVTIASAPVPFHEAFRFGILSAGENGKINLFEEKPKNPKSNLASMGVYIFKWSVLKKRLLSDSKDDTSSHDFGKNIVPNMLSGNEELFTYTFDGYWKDIGTVYSLWEANMDLIHNSIHKIPVSDMSDMIEMHRSAKLEVRQSIVADYRKINGRISNSVISENVRIGEGSVITDCVIMPNATIGKNVRLNRVIVGSDASVMNNVEIGTDIGSVEFTVNNICSMGVSLVGSRVCITEGMKFKSNSHIDKNPILKTGKYIPHSKPLSETHSVRASF